MLEDALDKASEGRLSRQVWPVACEVDASALVDYCRRRGVLGDCLDYGSCRNRPAFAAPLVNDAEFAAMIAAILDLDECSRVIFAGNSRSIGLSTLCTIAQNSRYLRHR